MSHYAAFLRGLNLGGQRRVTNADLGAAFMALGFTEVRTFRASGNVTFEARAGAEGALARRIERGLAGALGYEVPTFVRSAEEVRRIAAEEPFPPAAVRASTGKLHVALLPCEPPPAAAKAALALASEEDRLALGARELYWLPRGRMIDSGLDVRRAEKLLGPWTMRTKATIEGMAGKHFEVEPAGRRAG